MRILVELPTWLGDAVMVTPALENLISFHKDSEVILLGSSTYIEIFKNHPHVSQIRVLDKRYLSLFNFARKLGKFDKFFSFRNSIRSFFFQLFISSRDKFKFNRRDFQHCHQVEKYNNFINKSLNTQFYAGELTIYSDNSLKEKSNLTRKKLPMLGINPGASYGSSKRWYPEEFANVAAKLSSEYDITILGGPNEIDISMDIQKLLVKKGVTNYQNLAGNINISELIHHISNLDLFVTGDSGPMHIAASYQVPTVSIFGPTRDNETSQWLNRKSIIVKKNLDCQPCMKRVCPLKHHNCMKLIKAKDILVEVESLNSL
jgi:heptosyltransferase II